MVKVKICGIKRVEDALVAAEYGADALGFVFYKKSPRYISPPSAWKIIKRLPPFISTVGVFVNPAPEEVKRALEISGIKVIQLHGEEEPELIDALKVPVIKAIRIEKKIEERELKMWKDACAFLVEGKSDKGYGGTGTQFDYEVVKPFTKNYRIIIAGGLNPSNVSKVVKTLRPYGVDVSSGVEESPGVKSHKLIKEFIRNAKSAR
jgi:phosphoribosylanthranilate isomerase